MFKHTLEEKVVKAFRLQEVNAKTFYRTVFPKGSLEERGNMQSGKYNAMICAYTPDNTNGYILCMHDDLSLLDEIRVGRATMNCVSYIGESREPAYERELFAFFIRVNASSKKEDIEQLLTALQGYLEYGMLSQKSPEKVNGNYKWGYSSDKSTPFIKPTYLVVDNEELYFCFVMQQPIPMFENYQRKLQAICNDVSKKINQGLRLKVPQPQHILEERTVVGKAGCRAYKLSDGEPHRISLDELNSCVAKVKQLRISTKKEWTCKPELFTWFEKQVYENADNENLKPRVFVTVAAYAVKSGTNEKTFKQALDEIAALLAHRFTEKEIKAQLTDARYFYAYNAYWLRRRTIEYLSEECGFEIKKNKRTEGKSHQTRADHCRKLNEDRKVEKQVQDWMARNPGAKKIDCAYALGISPSTVTKWLKMDSASSKKTRKSNACPFCGKKLKRSEGNVKFHEDTGTYRQTVFMVCDNQECEKYKQTISFRHRKMDSHFQTAKSSQTLYVHTYKENELRDSSQETVEKSMSGPTLCPVYDDDPGLPW